MHFHQKKSAFVENYRNLGMLALKEVTLLNHHMQVFGVNLVRVVSQRKAGATCCLRNMGPIRSVAIIDNRIAEFNPGCARQISRRGGRAPKVAVRGITSRRADSKPYRFHVALLSFQRPWSVPRHWPARADLSKELQSEGEQTKYLYHLLARGAAISFEN
jgi:hypothetical protein